MALIPPTKRWHLNCDATDGEYNYNSCYETIWGDTKEQLLEKAAAAGWAYNGEDSKCPHCNWEGSPVKRD